MKDSLVTAALAVAALTIFYALFANRGVQPVPVTRPVSTEAGPNGYLGMARWLRAQQIEPLALRERFTRLAGFGGSPRTGNLLISTAPHVYPPRISEIAPLRGWVESGNTLLLVAGLSDTPEWAVGADPELIKNLTQMTGLSFSAFSGVGFGGPGDALPAEQQEQSDQDETVATAQEPEPAPAGDVPAPQASISEEDASSRDADDESQEPDGDVPPRRQRVPDPALRLPVAKALEMLPIEPHPLLEGVEHVQAVSEYLSDQWRATPDERPLVLALAETLPSHAPVLWLARAGRGQIIISGFGSVFTNKLLGKQDNAQLLANVVRWSLLDEGRVIIDDAHQGAVEFYDPQAFFGDRRLHRTLWCLLALWLVFVLGPQRLRLAAQSWHPADLTRFVRATGGFMARVLTPATAARRMFALFFAEVHRRTGLPMQDSPPWAWLEAHAGVDASDMQRLRKLHADAQQNRRINLQQLHNLLSRVRGSWLQH